MRRLIPPAVVGMLVLAATSVTPTARAGLLNPAEASALIQSTATDTDAMLLALFNGFEAGQTLNYSSSLTTTAWSGTLSGTYAATGLSLTYLGDLSNYPSGAVTWTSTGSYGSQSWSGNGSATITDTSSTTFQVGLSYSMTVGSNSASISYLIPGTVTSNGTIMYGGPGNEEAGTGALDLNGVTTLNNLRYYYKHILCCIDIISDIHAVDKKAIFENDYEFDEFRGIIIGPVSSPPPIAEPSSFVLMGLGLLGLAWIGTRRKGSFVC